MNLAVLATCCALVGCSSSKVTPESVATGGKDGDHVEVTGEVHAITFDTTRAAAKRVKMAAHRDSIEWVLEQDDEEAMGRAPSTAEASGDYLRTDDRYILIRSIKPEGITFQEPGFNANRLVEAWGLAVHAPPLGPGDELPEVGATIKVTGTLHRTTWNERVETLPIIDDAAITIVSGPEPLKGSGASCALDQECNTRLICDRTTRSCGQPPREIFWADPWHDVNGACDVDADCPLGQVCEPTYVMRDMAADPEYGVRYLAGVDVGRHLCRLAAGATVATQCPKIYSVRDLVGGRFATGKEVCVRVKSFVNVHAEDGDTHAQMVVDEPIPYPTADAPYNQFGGTTESGPMYKDPTLPGGPVLDPPEGTEVIAVGTYRFDPSHGWYEVHPVKAFLPAP